jgi:aminoglycoside phosphotransferase (APT) family kinase protein
MQAAIEAFLRERGIIPKDSSAAQFTLLSGGNSHVTWRVRAGGEQNGAGQEDVVVKVAKPDGPLAPYNVAHESAMMTYAQKSGVPAPAVLGYHDEPDGASFIVMRFINGDVPSLAGLPAWLDQQGSVARFDIAREMVRTLRLMRATQPVDSIDLRSTYGALVRSAADKLREAAGGIIDLPCAVDFGGTWLVERFTNISDGTPCLVHGDFRIGNAVFERGKLVSVLDWERAMIGHPMNDVGYLCLPGMKNGDRIAGLVTKKELSDLWSQEIGETLDMQQCALFRIVSIYIEFCNMLRVAARLAQGVGRLEGLRPLPLIARLHADLLSAIRNWEHGDFTL